MPRPRSTRRYDTVTPEPSSTLKHRLDCSGSGRQRHESKTAGHDVADPSSDRDAHSSSRPVRTSTTAQRTPSSAATSTGTIADAAGPSVMGSGIGPSRKGSASRLHSSSPVPERAVSAMPLPPSDS
jgi:hypothetical protein